jgi:hypothetical protein
MPNTPQKSNQITGPNDVSPLEVVANDFPDLLSFWMELYESFHWIYGRGGG